MQHLIVTLHLVDRKHENVDFPNALAIIHQKIIFTPSVQCDFRILFKLLIKMFENDIIGTLKIICSHVNKTTLFAKLTDAIISNNLNGNIPGRNISVGRRSDVGKVAGPSL